MVFLVRDSVSSTDSWSKSRAGWGRLRWGADRVVDWCGARGTTNGQAAEVLVWRREKDGRDGHAPAHDVRINHGRPYILVAEEFLHRADIGTVFEQVRRE